MKKSTKIVLILVLSIVLLSFLTSLSPELAIRRDLLIHFHPIQSITLDIEELNYDQRYGYRFVVHGYKSHEWLESEAFRGMGGNEWYLKKIDLDYIILLREVPMVNPFENKLISSLTGALV